MRRSTVPRTDPKKVAEARELRLCRELGAHLGGADYDRPMASKLEAYCAEYCFFATSQSVRPLSQGFLSTGKRFCLEAEQCRGPVSIEPCVTAGRAATEEKKPGEMPI